MKACEKLLEGFKDIKGKVCWRRCKQQCVRGSAWL